MKWSEKYFQARENGVFVRKKNKNTPLWKPNRHSDFQGKKLSTENRRQCL